MDSFAIAPLAGEQSGFITLVATRDVEEGEDRVAYKAF